MNRLFWCAPLALVVACNQPATADDVRDVRVEVPAADPAFADFVTPEQVIQPGEEKMWCSRIDYHGDDSAYTYVDSIQGKFGHHVILLAARADDPSVEGDVYDCTEMTNFEPFAIPINNIPAGYGSYLPKGKRLIVQMHYVNTGEKPIRVRDVIRLTKKPVGEVTTWAAPYATNNSGFSLPPRAQGQKLSFDCTLPVDAELLALGGHMHENGASFKLEIGPSVDQLTELYSVAAWRAEYRDSPPISLFTSAPKQLAAGTVIRTTCEWNNATDSVLQFPKEMCASFAVLGKLKDGFACEVGARK